jgi:hypothetical protein
MTNQQNEIKNQLCDCLAQLSDQIFIEHGFTRRPRSVRYDRQLGSCVQQVDLSIEHGPKDNPDAAAAIYPWLTVACDEVNSIVRLMTNGDATLFASEHVTLQQPIEIVAPKGVGARWYVYQPDSVSAVVKSFVDYAQCWLFRFLDVYSNSQGIVLCFEGRDSRVINVQDQYLRVIAAMLHLGRFVDASNLLNSKFGRPAIRRKYAAVFDYVEKKSGAG